MSDNYGTAVFLERWWIPLFYVTVAAVVVMIDLLVSPREIRSIFQFRLTHFILSPGFCSAHLFLHLIAMKVKPNWRK